ncbi:hypothetical protein EYV94_18730 [Puteibacter caeruleilacunae]|nr:hypothetical protein EYV94_18730 [Puteibacter caeruleilacunae]
MSKKRSLRESIKKPTGAYWLFFDLIVVYVGLLVIASFIYPAVDQVFMVGLSYLFVFFPLAVVILTAICFIVYIRQIRSFWHYNLAIMVFFALVGIIEYNYMTEKNKYYKSSMKLYENGSVIKKTIIYYGGTKSIHSIEYLREGLKDSIWPYYNKNGELVRTIEYEKDTIVTDSIILPDYLEEIN